MSETTKWYSMDEIAEHLGFSRDTISKLIKKDNLPASKVGGKWLFDVEQVDLWVKENSYTKERNKNL